MRRLFALLLALVMMLSLAACGGGDETPSGNEDNPSSSGQQQEQNTPDLDEGGEGANPDTSEQKQPEDSDKETPSGGDWPTEGLAALVPAPGFGYTIVMNNEKLLTVAFNDIALDDLKAYVEEVKAEGFTENEVLVDTDGLYSFQALNADGYSITVGNQMIQINAPKE